MRLNVTKNNVPLFGEQIDNFDLKVNARFYIGRNQDCHVWINDPRISRYQCELSVRDNGIFVKNNNDKVRVLHNGKLLDKEVKLVEGSNLTIFDFHINIDDIQTFQEKFFNPINENDQSDNDIDQKTNILISSSRSNSLKALKDKIIKEEKAKEEVTKILTRVNLDSGEKQNNISDQGPPPAPVDLDAELYAENPSEFEQNPSMDSARDADDFDNQNNNQDNILDGDQGGKQANDHFNDDNNSQLDNTLNRATKVTENLNFSDNENKSDASFSDDGFGHFDENISPNDSTQIVQSFVRFELILTGPCAPFDRFEITEKETFVGRGDECAIVLNDPEVSTKHAVFKKIFNSLYVEDLKSGNGVVVNSERINKVQLNNNDLIQIGSSSLRLKVVSEQMNKERERLMPVDGQQFLHREEILEEISMEENTESNAGGKFSLIKMWRDPVKRKRIIMYGAVLAVLLLLIPTDEEKVEVAVEEKKVESKVDDKKVKLSPEKLQELAADYRLGVSYYNQQNYADALKSLTKVYDVDPTYEQVQGFIDSSKAGLKKLKDLEEKRIKEEQYQKLKLEIAELINKAKEALKEKQFSLVESLLDQILQKDPENLEAANLRVELNAIKDAIAKAEAEKREKEQKRQAMVDALVPAKQFYLKEEWYKAILKLDEFLVISPMDEDLISEAKEMLKTSKEKLEALVNPLLSKAVAAKEGNDFKLAFETMQEVLKVDPNNTKALNEVNFLFEVLENRAKKIYREALVSESLSLFQEAKEKFEEVKLISPSGSDYYLKAVTKLKNYLD